MTHALAEHYGRWVAGWRWAHDEGDFDGGPVGNWSRPQNSVTTPDETLDRVTAALREWREWLESLAARFEAYPLDLADIDDQRILWDRTARNLILHVTDRTGCGSGWYAHCHQVLSWFLSRWGVPADDAEHLVEQAIGGRFESWTGPDPVLVEDIAERLAVAVRPDAATRASASPLPDHLTRWLAVRDGVPWHEAADSTGDAPVTPVRDGMAEEIRAYDAVLDPARGQGLLTALELMRADAARGARLDFDLIQRWQQHVLATPGLPPFRRLPAFAKGGRERYGIARTPAPASTPASPKAPRTWPGPCRSPPGPHAPSSTSASSTPSTTAMPAAPCSPSSSSSPAKTSHSTACNCYAGSPSTPTTRRTR
jgi:hypothetical protein